MRETGMTRPLDNLGRVVIPSELRKSLNLKHGDRVEFFVNGNSIALKKYCNGCQSCGDLEETVSLNGIKLCAKCISKMSKIQAECK